jgi:hypothetical protein
MSARLLPEPSEQPWQEETQCGPRRTHVKAMRTSVRAPSERSDRIHFLTPHGRVSNGGVMVFRQAALATGEAAAAVRT